MPATFNDLYESEFKQLTLIVTNLIWLALEWFYFDTSKEIQFPIIRMIYFMFVGITRAEGAIQKDNTDLEREDEMISKELIKTIKVFLCDVASWFFLIWAFGRSLM
jgi:hypothetical protein